MDNVNHIEYDTLTLQAKKEHQLLIDDCYKAFGWEKIAEQEDRLYADTNELKFKRVHKIENKDDLQILQVHLEHHLNILGKLEQTKFPKTIIVASIGGVVALSLMIGAIVLLYHIPLLLNKILGGILSFVSIVAGVFVVLTSRKLHKKELEQFVNKKTETNNKISEICNKAKMLRGGKHASKNTKDC